MNINDYLDAAKTATGSTSDYALAKKLDVSKQAISNYRNGISHPDTVMAFRLAITLNLDPTRVVAELESQREPDGKRGDFWRSFLSRAAMVLMVGMMAFNFSGIYGTGAERLGGRNRRFSCA